MRYHTHRVGKSGHEIFACLPVATRELSGQLLLTVLGCPGFLASPPPPGLPPAPRLEQDLELEVEEAAFLTIIHCNKTDMCPKHFLNRSQ